MGESLIVVAEVEEVAVVDLGDSEDVLLHSLCRHVRPEGRLCFSVRPQNCMCIICSRSGL